MILLAASIYWQLPLLVLVISLVYSATRFDHWDDILMETYRWGRNMVFFMACITVAVYVLSRWIDYTLAR